MSTGELGGIPKSLIIVSYVAEGFYSFKIFMSSSLNRIGKAHRRELNEV
jgi:hypothetical protein